MMGALRNPSTIDDMANFVVLFWLACGCHAINPGTMIITRQPAYVNMKK
jgi:hypothetical protein